MTQNNKNKSTIITENQSSRCYTMKQKHKFHHSFPQSINGGGCYQLKFIMLHHGNIVHN